MEGNLESLKLSKREKVVTAMANCTNLLEFFLASKTALLPFNKKITQFVEEERLKDTYPYLHNVTVAGHTKEKHDKNVKAFLDAIKRRNFTLNESKTVASKNSIPILGYVVGNGEAKPDLERLRPLLDVCILC